jgi:hypothetical protein
MNRDYEIYRAPEDQIPKEDRTRLEGFLEGRAEAAKLERYKKEIEEKQKEFEKIIK